MVKCNGDFLEGQRVLVFSRTLKSSKPVLVEICLFFSKQG